MSFEELVKRYRGEMVAYLVRLLGNRDDAEDACQDALLRAYRAFGRLRAGSNSRAWLYRIATRSALNVSRSRRRRGARRADVEPDTLPAPPALDPAERERRIRVVRAVQALPAKQRAALMQRQFHGLRYDEIGAALECSAEAARANVYHAIKKLRAAFIDSEDVKEGEDAHGQS